MLIFYWNYYIMNWLIFKYIFVLIWLLHNVLFRCLTALALCTLKVALHGFLANYKEKLITPLAASHLLDISAWNQSLLLSLLQEWQLVTPACPLLESLLLFPGILKAVLSLMESSVSWSLLFLNNSATTKTISRTDIYLQFSYIRVIGCIRLNCGSFVQ